ncbi:hypothetical protein FEP25_06190 [Burkholderia multivorans]|nr:hypothetical protein [Burkholderia multivorans]
MPTPRMSMRKLKNQPKVRRQSRPISQRAQAPKQPTTNDARHQCLRRKQGVTLQLLWEEYAEANPGQRTYRYTQFCQKYKDWAKSIKRSMRQQHRAGEKLFADFAGPTVPVLASDGGVEFEAHVFVAVLGASNYTFACATRTETMADWIGSLCDALEFIGGVPELLVPDNRRR